MIRKVSIFRDFVSSDEGNEFQPEGNGRYHLYISYACPWAHRTLIFRALKGLKEHIGVTIVHPVWKRSRPNDENDPHCGWPFAEPNEQVPHIGEGVSVYPF
jgi:putative glutathione S-transferase